VGIFSGIANWFKVSPSSTEEEVTCACGGQCACKGEPESAIAEVAASSTTTTTPVFTSSTSNAAEISTTVSTPEPMVTARKIEDASTLPPLPIKRVNQPKLPGFEDDLDTLPKPKKRSNTKASAKLPRKSTTKRNK